MKDRNKNYNPSVDNELCDCQGNYYSTKCIILDDVEGQSSKELNIFLEYLLDKIELLEARVNNLENV